MAKEKRSAADLDAELAALEAELAALEGKPKKAKKKDAPPPALVPTPTAARAPAPDTAEPPPEARAEKKSRFALPKLGKKKPEPATAPRTEEPSIVEAMSEPHASPASSPPSSPSPIPAPSAVRPPPSPSYDLSLWRQEGDAWVRAVPDTPVPVMRRVLDESGNLVREEPASMRDVDDASGVKAERGLGRLLRRK